MAARKCAAVVEINVASFFGRPIAASHLRQDRVAPGHTAKTACETTANASERPPTHCSAMQAANHWPALAGDLERAMGIENTAGAALVDKNHSVGCAEPRCV